jgi:hypothetical protein
MDLASIAAEPGAITLGGREYRPGKIRPRDIAYLEAWFREVTPDPRVAARAAMEGLPAEVQKHIWDRACDEARSWPPRLTSEAGRLLILSDGGLARLVHTTIRQTFPAFTLDEAAALSERMAIGDVERFFAIVFPASSASGAGADGPKADPAPAGPSTGGG